ncbi:hypothetical protein DRQ33_07585 [bacterium]|nr:MAG: hypothetical protein DRQ33_07585 [bacterium]
MNKWILVVILLLACSIWAQPDLQIVWHTVSNGGIEFPEGRITSGYKLADNIGNGGTTSDTFLTDGSSLILYPGYRYVELDLRKPISRIDSTDTITHSPSFLISWSGEDTTTEDGEGWGIRYYDVEYAVEDSTAWNTWFTGVTFTSAMFGPTSPVTVKQDSTYYFRVRAYDLATNEEDTHSTYDQWVIYKPIVLSFRVYNPTSDTAIWAVSDTFDPGETVTMTSGDVLLVENTSLDSIELALSGTNFAIDTTTGQPYWELTEDPGNDQFSLRGHFDDEATPPVTFTSSDAIIDSWRYAKDGWFGGPSHGWLAPNDGSHTAEQYSDNLWLQVLLPTSVTQHGDTIVYQFMVNVKGMSITR